MRIGLLGGSFNPAHEGHLHVSETARKRLALDYVWWLVSPQNPLKPAEGMASFAARLASARHLVARNRRIRISRIEQDLRTAYTADTLRALQRRFPGVVFVWLMGSDNLFQISKWRRWQEIFYRVPVAVVTRPGTALAGGAALAAIRFRAARRPADRRFALARPPAWTILEAPRSPASATRLRAAAAPLPFPEPPFL